MSSIVTRFSKKGAVIGIIVAFVMATSFSFLATARLAHAFPWGGQFQTVIPCFNAVIWTLVGPPRGGAYIWVPGATRTYDNGPPSHPGQWGIGLAAPPYFCIVSPLPLIVWPGIIMTMLGTSQ